MWCILLCSGLPSVPLNLTVENIGRDSATLRWERPDNTGGVPLSGYIIEQQEGRSGRWRVAAYVEPTRTWWTLQNLIQGYEYNFRVRAENPDGAGKARVLHTTVIPKPVLCKFVACRVW